MIYEKEVWKFHMEGIKGCLNIQHKLRDWHENYPAALSGSQSNGWYHLRILSQDPRRCPKIIPAFSDLNLRQ